MLYYYHQMFQNYNTDVFDDALKTTNITIEI